MWRERSIFAKLDTWMVWPYDLHTHKTCGMIGDGPTLTIWSTAILMASPDLHGFLIIVFLWGYQPPFLYLFFSSWSSSSSSCFPAFLIFLPPIPSHLSCLSPLLFVFCFFHGFSLSLSSVSCFFHFEAKQGKEKKGKEERTEETKQWRKKGRNKKEKGRQLFVGLVWFKPTIELFCSNFIVECFVRVPPFFISLVGFSVSSSSHCSSCWSPPILSLPLFHFHPLLPWRGSRWSKRTKKNKKGRKLKKGWKSNSNSNNTQQTTTKRSNNKTSNNNNNNNNNNKTTTTTTTKQQ